MDEAEREHEGDAPRVQLAREHVLDRDVDDRKRNQRLDDRRTQRNDPVDGQREGDRIEG